MVGLQASPHTICDEYVILLLYYNYIGMTVFPVLTYYKSMSKIGIILAGPNGQYCLELQIHYVNKSLACLDERLGSSPFSGHSDAIFVSLRVTWETTTPRNSVNLVNKA